MKLLSPPVDLDLYVVSDAVAVAVSVPEELGPLAGEGAVTPPVTISVSIPVTVSVTVPIPVSVSIAVPIPMMRPGCYKIIIRSFDRSLQDVQGDTNDTPRSSKPPVDIDVKVVF